MSQIRGRSCGLRPRQGYREALDAHGIKHDPSIGRQAAEMLFERLSADEPVDGRREVLPFKLVVRESAGLSR